MTCKIKLFYNMFKPLKQHLRLTLAQWRLTYLPRFHH
jgi:hypothetical protein